MPPITQNISGRKVTARSFVASVLSRAGVKNVRRSARTVICYIRSDFRSRRDIVRIADKKNIQTILIQEEYTDSFGNKIDRAIQATGHYLAIEFLVNNPAVLSYHDAISAAVPNGMNVTRNIHAPISDAELKGRRAINRENVKLAIKRSPNPGQSDETAKMIKARNVNMELAARVVGILPDWNKLREKEDNLSPEQWVKYNEYNTLIREFQNS